MHPMDDDFVAGDTWDWSLAVDGYPATDGWTLKYYLTPRIAGTQIVLTAATASDGLGYRVQVSPATSAGYAPGMYEWRARVEKAGAEVTVAQFSLVIQAKVAGLTASDNRSHARKVLDAIEALIETKGTADVIEYSIGSRSIKKMTTAELLPWRDKYRWEVADERARDRIADNLGNPRLAGVRFNRV